MGGSPLKKLDETPDQNVKDNASATSASTFASNKVEAAPDDDVDSEGEPLFQWMNKI